MSEKVTVDITYQESQYTTYRSSIDPDHYEEVMGEPLRGSHPFEIEKYIYKNNVHSQIVDEEADTAVVRNVDVDHVEEWSYF